MNTERAWKVLDAALVTVFTAASVVGCLNYHDDSLPVLGWTFVTIMTGEATWIFLRTCGAIHKASDHGLREQFAMTPRPAKWFVDRFVGRAMWRALWPAWLMPVQAALICLFEANRSNIISVLIFTLLATSAIFAALCGMWDYLGLRLTTPRLHARAMSAVLAWALAATVLSVAIPALIFLPHSFGLPASLLVVAPLILSAGIFLIRHRYNRAVAHYFQFE
ncbi:hypothetical protein IT570_01050 [Candidatus Sumerlaeota bacterium]|nr:hypothetical protein [Candidatus Sumerlaeota bacterium]